jgi:hypothetical protein
MKLSQNNFFMTRRFSDCEYYNVDAATGASLHLNIRMNYNTEAKF